VTLDVDRRVPERPVVRVYWPGVPVGLCPCSGMPITLHFLNGNLQDVFRLLADVSGLNVVVQPGVHGLVTYHANNVPWDEVLERMLAPNGYVAQLEGNVLWIGRPGEAGPRRTFTGGPMSFEYTDKDLIEALREVAANGRASVELPQGVAGHVTFKLTEVPWDQAFDLLARVNGLTWTRAGDVIRVGVRKPAATR
jgi:type II secretory pathway component HofQ